MQLLNIRYIIILTTQVGLCNVNAIVYLNGTLYHNTYFLSLERVNHIGGVMVGVIASSELDRGYQYQSCQTKDLKLIFGTS